MLYLGGPPPALSAAPPEAALPAAAALSAPGGAPAPAAAPPSDAPPSAADDAAYFKGIIQDVQVPHSLFVLESCIGPSAISSHGYSKCRQLLTILVRCNKINHYRLVLQQCSNIYFHVLLTTYIVRKKLTLQNMIDVLSRQKKKAAVVLLTMYPIKNIANIMNLPEMLLQ